MYRRAVNTGTSGGVGLGYSRVIELPKLDISVIKSDPAKHAAAVPPSHFTPL